MNDWDVFKKRAIHFIHVNINTLLPKIDDLCYITNITNVSIIGISELSGSVAYYIKCSIACNY